MQMPALSNVQSGSAVGRPRAAALLGLLMPLLVLLLLVGCSTPQAARDLAAQGAVMTDKSQAETEAFIERAARAYQRREAVLRGLTEGQVRDSAQVEFRAWVDAQAGVATPQATITLITEIAERSRALRETMQAALEAKAKQMSDAAGPPVKAPSKSLADAKKAFLNLSNELTAQEWLKFSQDYVKQVRADLKALQDKAED